MTARIRCTAATQLTLTGRFLVTSTLTARILTQSGGGGGGGGGSTTLAPGIADDIASEGGADAGVLREVATSPTYGAPTKKLELPGAGESGAARAGREDEVLAGPQA